MRKEYKDLSDKQRLNYIKRNIVITSWMIIPLVVGAIILVGLTDQLESYGDYDFKEDIESKYPNNGTHTIMALPNEVEELTEAEKITARNIPILLSLLMVILIGGVFGCMYVGADIGTYISNKLGWYTDFELDRAKERVVQIEETLKK